MSYNEPRSSEKQVNAAAVECKICGASAKYSYFGIVSCQPCKMFFKRNAEQGQNTLQCNYNKNCEINLNNRHVCSYCRLQKCFTSGMEAEKIRRSLSNKRKRKREKNVNEDLAERNSMALVRLNESKQFPTLNLLRSDQSTLTADQWNLLSNLTNCYNENGRTTAGQRYMQTQNSLPIKLRFKATPLIQFIQASLDDIDMLYNKNQDFLSLSANDRSVLLHMTLKHTASLSANYMYHQVGLSDCIGYLNTLASITNVDLIPIAKRVAERVKLDTVVMKLFLATLCFSTINITVYSNSPPLIFSNIKQILDTQNKYIEITWRYILYKYDHEQAVKCFSDLIRCILAIHAAMIQVENIQWFESHIDTIIKQTEKITIVEN
ncbi:unnamed protein product [Adineta steineri]|uniref:Nuclear receptor domain-containing protein n=1 Tax=Adineta steineri TaxID=433720 RepID=A0A815H424_9BILA|nr:unnamed protein product [Adineta steineri]CAF1595435.1 unnamed protein product [Adineta steineri]